MTPESQDPRANAVPSDPIFAVEDLWKSYGRKEVLRGVTFGVQRGECLVVLGLSGSGKSVLLRQLNGLEKADRGSVRFDGVEISTLAESDLFPYRRRIAMLFQGGALFDSMNVFDNVAFPIREHLGLEPDEVARRVGAVLETVQLPGVGEKMPSDLSGGMRKRVALARSLAMEPQAVLYDEPTTGLDPLTAATIGQLILTTGDRFGVTSVAVTHDLALARSIADRVGFLDEGRFAFLGTWDEARSDAAGIFKEFLAAQGDRRHVA